MSQTVTAEVPFAPVRIMIESLDDDTRRQLRAIQEAQGSGSPGWFQRQRSWTVCLALGAILIVRAYDTRRRRAQPDYAGEFTYIDGANMWELGDEVVKVTPIHTATELGGTHHHTNGAYTHTEIRLKGPGGSRNLHVNGKQRAEELMVLLNGCAKLSEDQGPLGELVRSQPQLRAPVVRAILRDQALDEAAFAELASVPPLVPQGLAPSGVRLRGQLSLAALCLAGAIGQLVLPPLHRTWVDDAWFGQASQEANQQKSPKALRRYLADARAVNHREAAQQQIGVHYDQAIAKLSTLQGGRPELVAALKALLEGLKKAERPVLSIGFAATHEADPQSDEAKQAEREAYQEYEENAAYTAGIKALEQQHKGSAILPTGELFAPRQVQTRERVITERMAAAMEKVLSADLIGFESAPAGSTPHIKIVYHTQAPGNLFIWTQGRQPTAGAPAGPMVVKGLLRGYVIGWTLEIMAPGSETAFKHVLASHPAQNLRYRGDNDDPAWAPYAILLYSAFHDFSSGLIRGFGLDPPPSPNSFSFDDATGNTAAIPPGPMMPGKPPLPGTKKK